MSEKNLGKIHTSLRFERITELHELIASGVLKNRSQWAKYLGVTEQTVHRDMVYLTDRNYAPIRYDQKQKAYVYEGTRRRLPEPNASESDLFAMAVAYKALAQYVGTPFSTPLKVAFAKVLSRLEQVVPMTIEGCGKAISIHQFATDVPDPDHFETLMRAIRQNLVVELDWQDPGKECPRKLFVQPYHLFFKFGAWYLLGFDESDGTGGPKRAATDPRSFKIDPNRMKEVLITSPNRRFQPIDLDIPALLQHSFAVKVGGKPMPVVIEFKRAIAGFIRERNWHPSQEVEGLEGGGLRLTMKVTDLDYLAAWVLGFGADAKVVKPARLRQAVQTKAEATSRLYEN